MIRNMLNLQKTVLKCKYEYHFLQNTVFVHYYYLKYTKHGALLQRCEF